jgi:hypothetical protein
VSSSVSINEPSMNFDEFGNFISCIVYLNNSFSHHWIHCLCRYGFRQQLESFR